jgi:hypothetical protein
MASPLHLIGANADAGLAVVTIKPEAGHPLVRRENHEKLAFDISSGSPYGDRLRFFTNKAANKRRADLIGHPMRL